MTMTENHVACEYSRPLMAGYGGRKGGGSLSIFPFISMDAKSSRARSRDASAAAVQGVLANTKLKPPL